jgi:hypothetical protein
MPKKSLPPHEEDGSILVNAAKVIGAAAGKIAALASAPLEARPAAKSAKVGKLPKKQGHRLPRRQKKAQQKLWHRPARASHCASADCLGCRESCWFAAVRSRVRPRAVG